MTSRRTATRRDLPGLCLLFSVIFAASAVGLPFGAKLELANQGDLQSISGSVQEVFRTSLPKAGPQFHINIVAAGRIHHLVQDDLFPEVPALDSLRPGDTVTVRFAHDCCGRDLKWFWEVQRGGVIVLSYQDTYRYMQRQYARMQVIGHWAGLISLALFFLGLLLRAHFGAWRDECGCFAR